MRILVIADVHGKYMALEKIINDAGDDIDVVVCPGDFTDMFDVPEEFSQIDIANIVLQKLLAIGKPLLCVPGNHDPYEIIRLFEDHGVSLNGTKRPVDGFNFVGWGGAPTPFNTIIEPSEEETAAALENFRNTPNMVLVVHNPPKNTKVDVIRDGKHVGSPAIRKFIEEEQPILSLTAHIHESPGKDRIGNTVVFYPGPAYEGNYGIVDINKKTVVCEKRQVR